MFPREDGERRAAGFSDVFPKEHFAASGKLRRSVFT